MNAQQVTNEQWATALQRFDEVLESSAPEGIIARQSDPGVRAALRDLWLQHQEADKCHFLEDQITIVPKLLAPAADVFVPEDILDQRFTVLRLLGRGGMGEVYLAADKLLTEMKKAACAFLKRYRIRAGSRTQMSAASLTSSSTAAVPSCP
jgi:hypothetical protein